MKLPQVKPVFSSSDSSVYELHIEVDKPHSLPAKHGSHGTCLLFMPENAQALCVIHGL